MCEPCRARSSAPPKNTLDALALSSFALLSYREAASRSMLKSSSAVQLVELTASAGLSSLRRYPFNPGKRSSPLRTRRRSDVGIRIGLGLERPLLLDQAASLSRAATRETGFCVRTVSGPRAFDGGELERGESWCPLLFCVSVLVFRPACLSSSSISMLTPEPLRRKTASRWLIQPPCS